MALQGNLEDLPLLDIVQIVSFSKKTGYLSIEMEGGEGAIVFHEGLVVSAFTATSPPADPRLGTLAREAREKAVRSRIRFALEQLARLREGGFGFELSDDVPPTVGRRDIRLETLVRGINPQEMLLDLAQGLDEDRAQSTAAVEASFATPEALGEEAPPPEPSLATPETWRPTPAERISTDTQPIPLTEPPPPPPGPASEPGGTRLVLLLVDDEADVRQIVARHFVSAGYRVVEAGDPEEAVKVARGVSSEGPFVLVTDLGMPASGGASFHGGFEVVKRLWKMNLRPPVLMMTDSLNQSLRLRARQMGVQSFVFKPTLSRLSPRQFEADISAFARKLVSDVLPRLADAAIRRAPAPPGKRTSGSAPEASPPAGGEDRPFEFLKRRLVELRQGGDANEIAILVMKAAQEFFERAILFVVKNDEARGLGGFGLAPREETLNLLARQVTIPLGETSVFRDVARERRPFQGEPPADRWMGHLMGRIGRFQSRGVALLPLVAHRETIALVFGDNPETGRPPTGLEGFEVFVQQAGIALENVFLQKKIQTIEGKDRTSVG